MNDQPKSPPEPAKASAKIVDELVSRHPHLKEAREALRSNEAHYAQDALASFRVRFQSS
jgi:hypothetical protein